ncbi:methylated-DNA--[protein]-cysteine S-methyltransferase [Plantactinospora sp. S1510]|uniref:Methylated-DNA--protein-cysteine methyltransferase n=1 Tax=Plantactinospora alkalitolerans TaxID=2789879 RepID=A0ABS0GUU9_9ACTN|nr:methylated-DNA--[protein]-cysteine S-methyltransferase [Plantactinospora alkalitolerans]MBF9129982.1 methylated-DNA--[protein]-cysteine S-methyltransferase [Plantactinospora alkalitolerans]
MMTYTTMESPLGVLLLAGCEPAAGGAQAALATVSFADAVDPAERPDWRSDPSAFTDVSRQLTEYFDGGRREFDLVHTARGTAFQQRVWAALDTIPYGTTVSYGDLAARLGVPRDRIRAVGAAIGANPLLIVRPCHRVIGASGALTGYAGGVDRKRELLTLEGALQPQLV